MASESLNPQDNPELYAQAVLGKQVEEFWDSDVGQYLLRKSLEEYNTALEEFRSCDLTNIGKLADIRARMSRSELFKDWLSVAISEGLKAINIIEGNDDEIS